MASHTQSTGVIHTSSPTGSVRTVHSSTDLPLSGNEKEVKTSTGDVQTPYGSIEEGEETVKPTRFEHYLAVHRQHRRIIWSVLFGALMTGWWIAGLILHRDDLGWLIPFLLWLFIMIRLVTLFVSTKYVTKPIAFVFTKAVYGPIQMIPNKLKMPLAGLGTIIVMILGTFVPGETADNTRANRAVSFFGLLVFITVFWATSRNRSRIQWQTVIFGMLMQFILALFVLKTKAGYDIFNFIAYLARTLLGFADKGTVFLTNADVFELGYFIINVVPAIIFFIALIQVLYFLGWLQWAIGKFAIAFFYTLKVSGAEAVVAAASPFVGQGESAMLIKPFIPHLTEAELHQVMTSGFATIAGSVLGAYIGLGISPLALISSCVMSIPASLAMSKLRYPETEESLTAGKIVMPEDPDEKPYNWLHALANGSWLGLRVGAMIIGVLLVIISLLGLLNGILGWWGHYLNINHPVLGVEMLVGYFFYPISFLLGVERNGDDIYKVAKLIGTKVVANEFVAFLALSDLEGEYGSLSPRSRLIATYAVCGFGNISSVGIQIGVLSQLGGQGQAGRVAKVALSALFTGVMSTLSSAAIAGMLIVDEVKYIAP